jgi:hypothetical protein
LYWYQATFYGNYYDLYYVYDNYYWIAAGAVTYCYTWWWWGNTSPESDTWSGAAVGYFADSDLYYVAYYYVDYDTNLWVYSDFNLGYGSVTYAYIAYGYSSGGDATFVGTMEYSWWYLTYDGWNYYSFGYIDYDQTVVGYGVLANDYVTFAISADYEYGWFAYESAVIYGQDWDFSNLYYGDDDDGDLFWDWNYYLMNGYYQ